MREAELIGSESKKTGHDGRTRKGTGLELKAKGNELNRSDLNRFE